MIRRYSDHAANERTFLAWVRTAIAMMAFGFVIERFDLFLRYATPPAAQQKIAPHGGAFANAAGLAFIVLGVNNSLYRWHSLSCTSCREAALLRSRKPSSRLRFAPKRE